MSSRYRVEFELVGNAGNIEAVLNRLNNGIRGVGNQSRQTTNEMGLWQRQMIAMGTTARYALAGGVVFGVTAAVGALSQFERKMGQIMATMGGLGTSAGFSQASKDIQSLGDYALNASIKLNTSVEQIQGALQIYYSSFDVQKGQQGVKQAEDFTNILTKLAAVSETTDFETLANGVIGFSQALGRGRPDIEKYSNEISKFVAISLGIRGDVLAQGIGNLGATARIGGFTGEQSLALLATAAQGGGSPAVSTRGLAQLQRVILRPTTPRQIAAYGAVGLPTDPVALSRMGGLAVLQRMLVGVRKHGGIAGVGGITADQLAEAQNAGDAGVTGGGAGIAFNLFGRAEALRAFTTIYSQQGKQKDFDYFLQQITQAGTNMTTLNDQFKAFLSQSSLSNVSNAFHAASIQAVRSLDPILHPAAGAVTGALGLATAHPRATMAVEGALFASLGARSLSKYIPGGAGKLLGRFGRFGGMGGSAASAALTGEAAANLLGGGATDGSRSNPYWVIIHPASAYVGSGGGYGPLGGGGPGSASEAKKAESFVQRWGGKIAAGGAASWRAIGLGGAATIGAAVAIPGTVEHIARLFYGQGRSVPPGHPILSKYAKAEGAMHPGDALTFSRMPMGGDITSILNRYAGGKLSADRAEGLLKVLTNNEKGWERAITAARSAANAPGSDVSELTGTLSSTIKVILVDKQGNEIGVQEQRGVPTKLWGARTAPQHRGKPKDTRKGR